MKDMTEKEFEDFLYTCDCLEILINSVKKVTEQASITEINNQLNLF